MDRPRGVGGWPLTSQEVAVSLVTRSAYLIYSAWFLLFTAGGLSASHAPLWSKVKAGFPFMQIAITAFQVRKVWTMRPLDFWNDIRVKVSLVIFVAGSALPFVVILYFIFFTPHSMVASLSLTLITMSVLFVFYGVLMLVFPRQSYMFDYGEAQSSFSSNGQRRFAGCCLLLAAILLTYLAIRMLQDPAFAR